MNSENPLQLIFLTSTLKSEILPQTYEIIPYLTKFTKHGQLPQKINLFSAKCSFFFPDEKDVHISTHKHQNRATIYIQISVQLQKIWERTNNGPIYLQTGDMYTREYFSTTRAGLVLFVFGI